LITAGRFDISVASGPDDWSLLGDELRKLEGDVRLDLGGIGKGHAVDIAVQALAERGVTAGWVNAGGDLRAFGAIDAPVQLRDEASGGVRTFAFVRDGAFATSFFGASSRSPLAGGAHAHVSVAAPLCLWADALTKVVAIGLDASDPLLGRFGARAWLH
jgi:thiamine biosynthesis lipoprotein